MWIDVDDHLPEIGRRVHVAGSFIALGTGNPVAYRRWTGYRRRGPVAKCSWCWESSEWRGTVAVHHWWDGPTAEGPPAAQTQ